MKKLNKSLICVSLVLFLSTAAFAGFANPDYRFQENSVHAIFEVNPTSGLWETTLFDTGPSSYQIEGEPVATEVPVSDNGSYVQVFVPNFIDELPYKLMRIQLTFDFEVLGASIGIDLSADDPLDTEWAVTGGSDPSLVGTEHYLDIAIAPNPDSETFILVRYFDDAIAPSGLNKIEVDTVSAPEPATMALLGLGCMGVLRRKR